MKRGQPGFTPCQSKMWDEADVAHDDEQLAALGYRVRSSDLDGVALKLQQLEEAMVSASQADVLTHLSSDAVHYNPSDLSTWLQSMLSEIGGPLDFDGPSPVPPATAFADPFLPSSSAPMNFDSVLFDDSSSSNQFYLGAIASDRGSVSGNLGASVSAPAGGPALVPNCFAQPEEPANKRLKSSPEKSQMPETTRSVVLVDSQENGVRLVHMLMACAQSVQQSNLVLAEALVKQIGVLATSQAGAMGKVATYFAEALARQIYGILPQSPVNDPSLSDTLQMHFYEACPYLKFAHFTANQAILEAFRGKERVHVIDFSMNQGLQWPALLQALAFQPGGPPKFRLTAISLSLRDNTDRLQEVGWKLAQFAKTIHVEFEYQGFLVNGLADLGDTLRSRIKEKETVAFNSIFELHKCLARPREIERVLSLVRRLNPDIFTVVEQEGDHNGRLFLDRFNESLHYYSAMFDSLEGCMEGEDKAMTEVYLGKQICNVVGSDGSDRVERHELLSRWKERLGTAGFEPVAIGSNAFKQASILLGMYEGGEGYKVEELNGCLILGWHTRPLVASSAWRPARPSMAMG
ncbi:hypothetical protein MLD38_004413 [Melastoma candidum]|uniref:Uncharacterized protein n=1 Tax=Melastoma candidum TaxID=119954 RepID=A0ACB9S751_9MYRT|nr:hypothetical protein MLD38_004413 [Melastoma candidum]